MQYFKGSFIQFDFMLRRKNKIKEAHLSIFKIKKSRKQLKDVFAAVGGLARDRNGWIIGFNRYLCNLLVLNVKFWDILNRDFERVSI